MGKKDWNIFNPSRNRNKTLYTVQATSHPISKVKLDTDIVGVQGQQKNVKDNAFSKKDAEIIYKDDAKSIGPELYSNVLTNKTLSQLNDKYE